MCSPAPTRGPASPRSGGPRFGRGTRLPASPARPLPRLAHRGPRRPPGPSYGPPSGPRRESDQRPPSSEGSSLGLRRPLRPPVVSTSRPRLSRPPPFLRLPASPVTSPHGGAPQAAPRVPAPGASFPLTGRGSPPPVSRPLRPGSLLPTLPSSLRLHSFSRAGSARGNLPPPVPRSLPGHPSPPFLPPHCDSSAVSVPAACQLFLAWSVQFMPPR